MIFSLVSHRIRLCMAAILFLAQALLLISCENEPDHGKSPKQAFPAIAVSNSWLECCLCDLGGPDLELLRVCPPGTCPGHFDIRPGTVTDLQTCHLMFLFDFQQSMHEKIDAIASKSLDFISIEAPEGLCVPSNYLKGCRAMVAPLAAAYPENRARYHAALDNLRQRLSSLEIEVREQMLSADLKNTKVVASGHQEMFCRWLGLDPVAIYSGSEISSPTQIDALLSKGKSSGVIFVIENQQEGTQAGEALAYQLGVPVVVFSNFPSMASDQKTFEGLVRYNVANLLKAVEQRKGDAGWE